MAIIKTETKQKSIVNSVSLTGVGLHTGKEVVLTFKPAAVNKGFLFKRVDLEGEPSIEADANYVTNTQYKQKDKKEKNLQKEVKKP